jgi:hypothetical protein
MKFTILKNYMHRACAARARARASREGRRDESTVNNSGSTSKLKIRLTGDLGNLLLFPSMGRVSCESKYRRRKVVDNNCTKVRHLVAHPPCRCV